MIASKRLTWVTILLVCLSVFACAAIVYGAAIQSGTTHTTEYETKLFGDDVLTINIEVSAEDWQNLLDNATAKEYIAGDLLINGVRFSDVGIRTKGNSSLSQVATMDDSDRYSLEFKFNYYVKGQTCYGLDSLCVNNMLGDATYMKDYLSYDIMKYIGVETPLVNYASVTVNGADYGFCVALERYDKSFLDRAYQTSGGQLYNVKIQMGQRDEFAGGADNEDAQSGLQPDAQAAQPDAQGNVQPDAQTVQPSTQPDAQTQATVSGRQPNDNMGKGGMGMGNRSGGGSLVYTDDESSSYSSIFDNAEFKGNSDKDQARVITAIRNLNEGTDLEKYFDVDQILRYLAAHTVVVNLDSYSSSMQQNYYIYEGDGKITILPWDYGLAFGGFQSGSATDVVNFPIDTPVSGVTMEERPLVSQLLAVPEYMEKYHEYLEEIAQGYFGSGLFEETIAALDTKISSYVKNDASAFFTYEEYSASLPALIELGTLRAQSIMGQLDGTIPSTTEGQSADQSSLIDASNLKLSVLGTMGGGGGDRGGQMPGGMPNAQTTPDAQATPGGQSIPGGQNPPADNMPDRELMQKAMQILQEAGGQLTDEAKAKLTEIGLTDEQISMLTEMAGRGQNGNTPPGKPGEAASTGGTVTPATNSGYAGQYVVLLMVLLLLLVGSGLVLVKVKKKY